MFHGSFYSFYLSISFLLSVPAAVSSCNACFWHESNLMQMMCNLAIFLILFCYLPVVHRLFMTNVLSFQFHSIMIIIITLSIKPSFLIPSLFFFLSNRTNREACSPLFYFKWVVWLGLWINSGWDSLGLILSSHCSHSQLPFRHLWFPANNDWGQQERKLCSHGHYSCIALGPG